MLYAALLIALLGAIVVIAALVGACLHYARERDDVTAKADRLAAENAALQDRCNDLAARLTRKPEPYRELASAARTRA